MFSLNINRAITLIRILNYVINDKHRCDIGASDINRGFVFHRSVVFADHYLNKNLSHHCDRLQYLDILSINVSKLPSVESAFSRISIISVLCNSVQMLLCQL